MTGMKRFILAAIFIGLNTLMLRSEPVVVTGKVINGKGLTIRLMTYTDQVSYLRETLQKCLIDENEQFILNAEIDSTTYCWLDIEFQQAELILQPGQSYEIEIDLKSGSLSASYFERSGLTYRIIKDDEDHLNLSIQEFNQLYNEFLMNISQKGRAGGSRTAYDNFVKAIELRFQNAKNPWFIDYLNYKNASMQLFMRLKSRENIGLEYISGQPVLYDHIEYMDFFHLYFEKYFLTGSKYFNFNKTYDLVNGTATASDILDSMKADPVLKDIDLRELLLLDGLKEVYAVSGFKRDKINALLTEIKNNGNALRSRELATHLMERLKRLQPGSLAPDFELSGVTDGRKYKLSDFSGKPVYLAFFDSQNPACLAELDSLKDICDNYRNKIAFAAISVDKDVQALTDYLGRAKPTWTVLHYMGNPDLLEDYDASTYPYFVLIDAEGRIARCPAPSPSENLEKLFSSF
jgi:thiol-disulfide isomerase/thioredoxin